MSAPSTPPPAKTPASLTAPKLPSSPSRSVTDRDLVSPAEVLSQPVSQQAAASATSAASGEAVPKKSLMKLIEEHFVQVDDLQLTGSHYPFRGVCKKCGWHTHQFDRDSAFTLTRSHAQTHWRDVQRFM